MSPQPIVLKDKVVLVTGATRGIGKGIAIAFGELGATVYITGRTVHPRGDLMSGSLLETQTAVEQAGGQCFAVPLDHQDDEQVRQLFEKIAQEQQGRLDVLINNVFAGVQTLKDTYGVPFWESDVSLWDACHQVGLRCHYVASQYAAKMMVPRRQGLICTISSWGSLMPIFAIAYGAGKTACDRMAADMALELAPHQVTSLSAWPGIVGTEQISQMVQELDEQGQEGMGSVMAARYNWETPLFVGRAIAALASDPNLLQHSGKVQIIAELAKRYRLVDESGYRPVSLRSLRFLIGSSIPALRPYDRFIADIRVPWLILLWKLLRSPQI